MHNRIKDRLAEIGMSQRELARRMGKTPSALHQFISSPQLKIDTYERVAKVLDIPVWTLMLSDDEIREIHAFKERADAGSATEFVAESEPMSKTGMVCPACGSVLVVSSPAGVSL